MKWLQLKIQSGDTIEYGPHRMTPRSLVFQLLFPFIEGGIIYHSPIALTVQSGNAPARTLPIINYTRLGQFVAVLYGLLLARIFWRVFHD